MYIQIMFLRLFVILFNIVSSLQLTIDDHGAIPNLSTNSAALKNTKAIQDAFEAAKINPLDKEVQYNDGTTFTPLMKIP